MIPYKQSQAFGGVIDVLEAVGAVYAIWGGLAVVAYGANPFMRRPSKIGGNFRREFGDSLENWTNARLKKKGNNPEKHSARILCPWFWMVARSAALRRGNVASAMVLSDTWQN